jgi:hypothetical protein
VSPSVKKTQEWKSQQQITEKLFFFFSFLGGCGGNFKQRLDGGEGAFRSMAITRQNNNPQPKGKKGQQTDRMCPAPSCTGWD